MYYSKANNGYQPKYVKKTSQIGTSGHVINQSITITPITTPTVVVTVVPPTSVSIIPVKTTMAAPAAYVPLKGTNVSTFPTTPVLRMPQTKATIKHSQRTPTITNEKRRSSSRFIKRKRFDDEIVEYSINCAQIRDQNRGRSRSISQSFTPTTTSISTVITSPTTTTPPPPATTTAATATARNVPASTAATAQTTPTTTSTLARVTDAMNNTASASKIIPLKSVASVTTVTSNQQKSSPIIIMKTSNATNTTPSTTNGLSKATTSATLPTTSVAKVATSSVTSAPVVTTPAKTTVSTPNSVTSIQKHATNLNTPSPSTSAALPTSISTSRSTTTPKNSAAMRPIVKNTTVVERRRTARSNRRRKAGTGRLTTQAAVRDLGRWKPIDDLTLITGVEQTLDLRVVHRSCKFSCLFTLQEIQARWSSLLYEPAISRTAVAAMRNLHPEMIESAQRKALFSKREEEILSYIKSTKNPELEEFEELLRKNATDFHSQRTAKSLQSQWQLMRQYQLLCDQKPKSIQTNNRPMTFSDAEDQMLDNELTDTRDETLAIELALADCNQKRRVRILDVELNRWNVLVDSITGKNSLPDFDSQTLAVLRGRLVRYLMRSKEITFGRDAKDQLIDVDLSLEGPASKMSRKQGTIKLRSNGDFFIANEGKRPIYINGVPLPTGNKTRLANNFVVEVCGLRLVFLTNHELINAIRQESAKSTAALN